MAPHGLCDTLSYIAGDFSVHCENEKQRKSAEEKFQNYCANLEKWAKSKYFHPKVQAVYNYISKKSLISDLEKDGIIELKENGVLKIRKSVDNLMKGFWLDSGFSVKMGKGWHLGGCFLDTGLYQALSGGTKRKDRYLLFYW